MNKVVKCNRCGRSFNNSKAFSTHFKTCKSSGQKTTKIPLAPKKNGASMKANPISKPYVSVGKQDDQITIRGTDRIAEYTYAANQPSAIVVDYPINPSSFKRLSHFSTSYQKIRYDSVGFEIVAFTSSQCSGGLVAAFIADPTDIVTEVTSLQAQQGSVTTKLWQNAFIKMPKDRRFYYTSEGIEVREYCPGKLLVYIQGPVGQTGCLVVTAKWVVTLDKACLENKAQTSKQVTLENDLCLLENVAGFATPTGGQDMSLFSKAFREGQYYTFPSAVTIPSSSNNGRIAHWLYVKNSKAVLPCYMRPDDIDEAQQKVKNLVLPKGAILTLWTQPPAVQGEAEQPSSSALQTVMADLGSSSEVSEGLNQLIKLILNLSVKSRETLETSSSE